MKITVAANAPAITAIRRASKPVADLLPMSRGYQTLEPGTKQHTQQFSWQGNPNL